MDGRLLRGKKWFHVKRIANLRGDTKILKWLETQQSIVDDITYYEKCMEPAAVEKETKSKVKK